MVNFEAGAEADRKKIKEKKERQELLRRRSRVADDAKSLYVKVEASNYKPNRKFSDKLFSHCIEISEDLNKASGKYIGTGEV